MIDKRPLADGLLVAGIYGEARRHARWRDLSADEEAAAVVELRELAGGRADLLAEVAGILEGAREGELDEPLARQAAALCRKAGADPEAILAWIEEGRRRAAASETAAVFGRPARWGSAASVTAEIGHRGHGQVTGRLGSCLPYTIRPIPAA